VAGRVQRHRDAVDRHPLAVTSGLERDVAEPGAQHVLAGGRRQVVRMAAARVVGVCVRDDGAPDRPPRIDVEVAGRAVQPLRPLDHEIVGHALCHMRVIAPK
jgi:hypothetical protein